MSDVNLEQRIDKFFRACCYVSAGMIYLWDNPLLREPLKKEHIKKRLLGHWGACPNIILSYIHSNLALKRHNLQGLFVVGPGHGAPGYISVVYLEGTLTKYYAQFSRDEIGLKRLFRAFSFPGGLGSHCTPELPGTIQEGGELGYTISHAFGAAFDNPDLYVFALVGDGEAETGPLAASWHSNKFLNPQKDGAVVPLISLNSYKINNPTILSRISNEELFSLFRGYGYEAFLVEGSDSLEVHQKMIEAMDWSISRIKDVKASGKVFRPFWPLIILKTPKGWTAPKKFKNRFIEGYWRSHQVPFSDAHENPESLRMIEQWLLSYEPQKLFDQSGKIIDDLSDLILESGKRLSDTPYSNGGILRVPLNLPDPSSVCVEVKKPCLTLTSNTLITGYYLRDVIAKNKRNFRVFGPDETSSNKLHPVFQFGKTWVAQTAPEDIDEGYLDPEGRVMEILSEHTIEGWLEGYILTGRHGILNTYEGFAPIISSMVNQFGKWLDISSDIPWRLPVSSLNLILTSVVWRQDHNGFTHQDPGFITSIVDKWPNVVRVYFPPDANTLLAMIHFCLQTTNRINIIVVDKQVHPQYLSWEDAQRHVIKGIGIFEFASNNLDSEPDVVLASCGDIPTKEAVAASLILREFFPDISIRFVNVVNLFKITPENEHPDGLPDRYFDDYFTTDKPIIFNFHGYPWLIHRLTYRRKNHRNLHVRGYRENRKFGIDASHIQPFLKGRGGIMTPLQLAIINQIDRFSIAIDCLQRAERFRKDAGRVIDMLKNMQIDCLNYAYKNGVDHPDFQDEVFFSSKLR